VRIGNDAYMQAQHDVWGAIIGSIYLFVRKRDRLDDRLWKIIIKQVEDALANWRFPDCGMWEVRGEPKHFTSSKIFCWVAAARGAGRPPPTRATPTCWPTRWTSGASSPRTTARRPWTPRRC